MKQSHQLLERIRTFEAATILFPDEVIERKHLRLVQRLCQNNELESYKIGRKYSIVTRSVFSYLDRNHGRPPGITE